MRPRRDGFDTKDVSTDCAGSGMLYDTYSDHESSLCKRNWLKNIFFVNNFRPLVVSCQLHTWFLAVDMQLFILAIPLIVCHIICTRFDATPGETQSSVMHNAQDKLIIERFSQACTRYH